MGGRGRKEGGIKKGEREERRKEGEKGGKTDTKEYPLVPQGNETKRKNTCHTLEMQKTNTGKKLRVDLHEFHWPRGHSQPDHPEYHFLPFVISEIPHRPQDGRGLPRVTNLATRIMRLDSENSRRSFPNGITFRTVTVPEISGHVAPGRRRPRGQVAYLGAVGLVDLEVEVGLVCVPPHGDDEIWN
jgi:hypothetical protein